MWAIKMYRTILCEPNICQLGHYFLTLFYQQLLVSRLFWLLACVSSEGRVSLSAKSRAHNRTTQQAAVPSHWCANRWRASPVHTVCQQLSGKLGPRHKSLMMANSRSKWGLLQDRRGYWEVKTFTEGSLLEMRVHSSHFWGAHNPAHMKIWVHFH